MSKQTRTLSGVPHLFTHTRHASALLEREDLFKIQQQREEKKKEEDKRQEEEKKMGVVERIREIEAEMARTQKNKATEYHIGQLKAKLAKLRTQLLEDPGGGGGGAGTGFEVSRYGHGRVALIGFPSVGKSTLLQKLTGTFSEVCAISRAPSKTHLHVFVLSSSARDHACWFVLTKAADHYRDDDVEK